MTTSFEILIDQFDVDAFENFAPQGSFSLGNACGLIWASQFSYEITQLR